MTIPAKKRWIRRARGASSSRSAPLWPAALGTLVALVALFVSAPAAAGEACAAGCASSCVVSQLREGACDARGECLMLPERACPGGFACQDATSCYVLCDVDDECASGYLCNAQERKCHPSEVACIDDHQLARGSIGGLAIDCAPYACSADHCMERCAGDGDCASPNVCNGANHCVPPPPDTSSSDTTDQQAQSCALVRAPASRDAAPVAPVALLVAAAIALGAIFRRRESRRRGESSSRSLPPARCR